MEEIINSFNNLQLKETYNERNALMIKMRSIDYTYGGMFEELYGILEEFLLYDGDRLFNQLKLEEIIYEMIDYISTDYMNYINTFIRFMRYSVSDNMRISDILYCIKNY
jgi:hypothetical protein